MRTEGNNQLRLVPAQGSISEPFDKLIFATGRSPNSASLGLQALGVELDAKGHVVVDDVQDTTTSHIPVSYTHLDVYKRQHKGCAGCSRPMRRCI